MPQSPARTPAAVAQHIDVVFAVPYFFTAVGTTVSGEQFDKTVMQPKRKIKLCES